MAVLNKYGTLSPRLIQPAKAWIEEEGPSMHEALATPSRFDYQRAEFTQRQPHHDLVEAINRYKEKAGKDALIDFNAKDDWTWRDVLEEAEKARLEYVAAGKGVTGLLRKVFRALGDNEPQLSPLLDLIPNDKYLSLLYGGLKLIFAAAKKMAEKRSLILESLEEMPDTVETAYRARQLFRSDQQLIQLATELHYALLDAIDCMISWLLEKAWKKQLKAVIHPNQYGTIVDSQLRRVRDRVTALRAHVELLNMRNNAKSVASLERIEPQISVLRQIGTETAVQTRETAAYTREAAAQARETAARAQETASHTRETAAQAREIHVGVGNVERAMNEMKLQQTAGLASQNGMFKTLLDQVLKAQWQIDAQQQALQTQNKVIQHLADEVAAAASKQVQGQQVECYATVPQLLELLMVDSAAAADDLHYVVVQGQADEQAPATARSLLSQPRFQDWLVGPDSGCLFVDGHDERHALDRVTPFTRLSAMLVLSLHQAARALPLSLACGLHAGAHDAVAGPAGLLRSLTSQLLLAAAAHTDFDLRFVHSRDYYAGLERHEPRHLLHTFEQLLRQLPPDLVVFCLLDGLLFFDRPGWRPALALLLPRLAALADPRRRHHMPGHGSVFKLLVTNARLDRHLRHLLPPHAFLELADPDAVHHAADRPLTERDLVLDLGLGLDRVAPPRLSPRPPALHRRSPSAEHGLPSRVTDDAADDDADDFDDEDDDEDGPDSAIDDYAKWPG
ncbi:MAG: hypothetical protein M1826_000266 [Phylliscum demangeonii]|nr:MAG: hypothetical protein M1826_000266 [Phylliscum demangeonii]